MDNGGLEKYDTQVISETHLNITKDRLNINSFNAAHHHQNKTHDFRSVAISRLWT